MLMIHTVNAYVALVLAMTLNPLLIYVILKHSVKEMRLYRKILLLTCFIDICICLTFFTVQPFGFTVGKFNMVVGNGRVGEFIGDLLGGDDFWGCEVFLFVLLFAATSLGVQFIFRYCAICRHTSMSRAQFFSVLAGASIWTWVAGVLYYYVGNPKFQQRGSPEVEEAYAALGPFMNENRSRRMCILIDGESLLWPILFGFEAICSTLLHVIIGMCIYKIHQFLKNHAADFSAKRMAADRQLSLVLIIQAVLPFVSLMIPNAVNFSLSLMKNPPVMAIAYLSFPVPWIAVVNPFVTICIIKSYRRSVLGLFHTVLSPFVKVTQIMPSSDSGTQTSTVKS